MSKGGNYEEAYKKYKNSILELEGKFVKEKSVKKILLPIKTLKKALV